MKIWWFRYFVHWSLFSLGCNWWEVIIGFGDGFAPNRRQTIIWHDDVIKWKHFPRYWPFVRGIHRSPVNSPHKGQWRGALMFSLICSCIYSWVNNREAGDLRRHRVHCDVIAWNNDDPVQRPILAARQGDGLNGWTAIYLQKCIIIPITFELPLLSGNIDEHIKWIGYPTINRLCDRLLWIIAAIVT